MAKPALKDALGVVRESARLLASGFPPEASDGHEGPHNAPDTQHDQMAPVEIGVMGKGTDERLIKGLNGRTDAMLLRTVEWMGK